MSEICSVMIADDEYWVRENLKNMIDWADLSILLTESAEDGEDALAKIESEHPDILICDINMPFLSGNELIAIAKERYPDLVVVVLSGYDDFKYVREALLNGAIDYLLKPLTKSRLLDVLDKALTVLGNRRTMEQEKVEMREKLLMATSILRDGEMSSLIAGGTSELELQFAVFTLILARLGNLSPLMQKGGDAISRVAYRIKNEIGRIEANGKVLAFHNVDSRKEFILVTDLDSSGVNRLCARLPLILEGHTGSSASIAVSGSYFSFDSLRSAYQEAHAALLARAVCEGSCIVRVEEVRDVSVQKRISAEQLKLLQFAIQSENRQLLRELVFDRILNGDFSGWLFIEVKQTAEYLAGMIFHHSRADGSTRSTIAMENFATLLDMAVESFNLNEVISLLEQLIDEVFVDLLPSGASYSMKQVVHRVHAYIQDHYCEELSLGSLALAFRVDRSYLSKAYKQVTSCNLMLAIANKRIEKASELIRERDLSLSEISSLVGYEEYAYFNRVFRKIVGQSPSEYKATMLKEVRR